MREISTPVASPCRHLQMHRNSLRSLERGDGE